VIRWRLICELLLVVAIVVLSIMLYKSKLPVDRGSNDISERIIKKLQTQLDDYQLQNKKLLDDVNILNFQIDSLTQIKALSKIIYIERIKKIEAYTLKDQVEHFDSVFKKNNLK
jgi:uncharacterized protein YoxC